MSQFLSLFLIIFALLAAAMALLAVRLFFGKRFVGTHVDQNRHLHAVTNGRLCPNAPATLPKNHNQ